MLSYRFSYELQRRAQGCHWARKSRWRSWWWMPRVFTLIVLMSDYAPRFCWDQLCVIQLLGPRWCLACLCCSLHSPRVFPASSAWQVRSGEHIASVVTAMALVMSNQRWRVLGVRKSVRFRDPHQFWCFSIWILKRISFCSPLTLQFHIRASWSVISSNIFMHALRKICFSDA